MDTLPEELQAAIAPAYELERELAGGGMSRVFLAHDQKLGRKVVVKVLPPDLAAGVNRDRFRREIQFAAQLLHPHIVQVLSAGETDSLLYYTMPYIEGESLRTQLERGEMSSKRVVRILHDVVDALAYAHERGIIHRDIKPGNILTIGSHALVTDFGVAKAISAAMPGSSSGVTSAGMAIGTPAYMAPEQLAADPEADHRVDIYAVGLLAYELLTGSSPFKQESPQATMAAQLTRVPVSLDVCCPGVSPELSRIVMSCLEKAPADRPASAKALLHSLDNIGMSSASTTAQPATVPAVSNKSPNKLLLGALAVAVIALGVALSARFRSSDEVPKGPLVSSEPKPAPVPVVTPAAPVVQKQRALTHADSIAIANAFREKVAPAPAAAAMSVAKASDVARPKVLILPPRANVSRPELTQAARNFSDALRKAIAANGNYSLVADSILKVPMMPRGIRIPIKPGDADVLVTMSFVGNEPQSLAIQLREMKTGRSIPVLVFTAPSGSPPPLLRDADKALTETMNRLESLLKR